MPHFDSVEFAVTTAQEAAEPLPTPPQHIDERAYTYWPAVINSKRRSAWTESDLLVACQLCRDYAAVETLSADLETDGFTLLDAKGKRYTNPAARLLDAATRRIHAGVKTLQIHALATQGKSDHQRGKIEAARELQRNMAALGDLIPQPQSMQMN